VVSVRTVETVAGEPLALVVRGDLVESVHAGHLVGLDADGAVRLTAGDPAVTVWPRSALKPLQAVAMLRAGLDLPDRLLALACASHSGDEVHREGVREILAYAGLDETQLRNTPALPLDPDVAQAWQLAGYGETRLTQNCSGKHAAMLATCRVNGWPLVGYLDADHPLQVALRASVRELTEPLPGASGVLGVALEGEEAGAAHVSVDGCGAPLFSASVVGLARAFARLARAIVDTPGSPEALVSRAMSQHPHMVAGSGRDATVLMQAVDGLIAKDGVDGVFVAAAADGRALAVKVTDGSRRPLRAVVTAALGELGVIAPGVEVFVRFPVEGGGRRVGEVRPVMPTREG
jgi:L-asparaginase II